VAATLECLVTALLTAAEEVVTEKSVKLSKERKTYPRFRSKDCAVVGALPPLQVQGLCSGGRIRCGQARGLGPPAPPLLSCTFPQNSPLPPSPLPPLPMFCSESLIFNACLQNFTQVFPCDMMDAV
jgi:hypothetical protein